MRDQRIDFARGIALIMIVMNHTVPPPIIFENFGHPQLGHVFAFAGADVFVYLSGYVCGIAYGKTLIERGFLATQTRALKRCVQIYIAAMIAFVVTWIAMKLFQQLGPYNVLDQLKFDTDFSFTSIGFLKSLLLIGPYTHFGILLFYIFLLLLLPTMLWLYERARPIAIAFSVGLWLLAQYAFFKKQEWIHLFDGAFGNILAWQLLFFMGMFIARDRKWLSSATGRFGTLICILILCLDSYMGQMKWMYFHFDKKEELGILRIVELLAAVVLVTRLVPPQASFFSTGWGARVRRLGSRSLTIFAATLPTCYIFTHLAAWVESKYGHSSHRLDVGRAGYLVLLGAHLLLILGFDSIMEMVERRKQRK
ncbi:MAG TPA: OpgC domain-containing protein [Tepidisphaeraceae bacterium]|nr:OpgC domain-containing protein [Tepidisphaeraceae bacterium]